MSDINSAYAALISNISERDTAKYVEQFDDILRTITNEMTKFEKRFGKIEDEEKMLAVKKLMSESLLNSRFRGTTMSYSELFVALENIIIDNVATARSRKIDTSAAVEIGMKAKEKWWECEPRGRPKDRRPYSAGSLQRNWQRKPELWQGSELERKRWQRGKDGGKNPWEKGSGKKGSKGQEKGGKGETRTCWTCGKTGHVAGCRKGGNHIEDDTVNIEE